MKKRKFKVGDIVVGNSEEYNITVKGWVGKVDSLDDHPYIVVRDLSENLLFTVDETDFDLVESSKKEETTMKEVIEVGDIVIGKKSGDSVYTITGEGWIGEVLSKEGSFMKVKELERPAYDAHSIHTVHEDHFSVLYKKGKFSVGTREFLIQAHNQYAHNYITKIKSLLVLNPTSSHIPVPNSLIDEALCDNICKEWKAKIREHFDYKEKDSYFEFGKEFTISIESYNKGPIMIGYGLVPVKDQLRSLIVDSEYEAVLEQSGGSQIIKFKRK